MAKDELRERAKAEIVAKFGTLRVFANYLGTTPENLNNKLDRMSGKFIKELEENGIQVYKSEGVTQSISHTSGGGTNANVHGGSIINNGEIQWLREKADLLTKLADCAEETKRLKDRLHEYETKDKGKSGGKAK